MTKEPDKDVPAESPAPQLEEERRARKVEPPEGSVPPREKRAQAPERQGDDNQTE